MVEKFNVVSQNVCSPVSLMNIFWRPMVVEPKGPCRGPSRPDSSDEDIPLMNPLVQHFSTVSRATIQLEPTLIA
jgi:hypothetical protein